MRLSYITSVWLLSILILPLVFLCWESVADGSFEIDMAWLMLFAGFLFSLPVYALCVIASQLVLPRGLSLMKQTIVWVSASVLSIGCTFFGLLALLGSSNFSQDTIQLAIVPMLATLFATGVLFKQLIRLNIHLNQQQFHDPLDATAVE